MEAGPWGVGGHPQGTRSPRGRRGRWEAGPLLAHWAPACGGGGLLQLPWYVKANTAAAAATSPRETCGSVNKAGALHQQTHTWGAGVNNRRGCPPGAETRGSSPRLLPPWLGSAPSPSLDPVNSPPSLYLLHCIYFSNSYLEFPISPTVLGFFTINYSSFILSFPWS